MGTLALMSALLFVDALTVSFATTPLLLYYGRRLPAWEVAVAGGLASALGSTGQLAMLRWALGSDRRWMRRLAPSRARLEAAITAHPAVSFLAILVARATPLPDAPVKLVAAASGYPLAPYGLAVLLGALPYYFALAWLGREFPLPPWLLVGLALALAAGFVLDRWRSRRARAFPSGPAER